MLQYKDFVPRQIKAPGFLTPGEHESFDHAVAAANQWLADNKDVQMVSLETVVLPNIWSRWEEGSSDAALGTSGEMKSEWYQFLRCWFRQSSDG